MAKKYTSDHHNDKFPQGRANPAYPSDNARKGPTNRGIGGENQDGGFASLPHQNGPLDKQHAESMAIAKRARAKR